MQIDRSCVVNSFQRSSDENRARRYQRKTRTASVTASREKETEEREKVAKKNHTSMSLVNEAYLAWWLSNRSWHHWLNHCIDHVLLASSDRAVTLSSSKNGNSSVMIPRTQNKVRLRKKSIEITCSYSRVTLTLRILFLLLRSSRRKHVLLARYVDCVLSAWLETNLPCVRLANERLFILTSLGKQMKLMLQQALPFTDNAERFSFPIE